jgi:hypothetical protein
MTSRIGRPRRSTGAAIRIPLNLTEDEDSAFQEAMEKVYPLATRSAVLRRLISEFCEKQNVRWPKEKS